MVKNCSAKTEAWLHNKARLNEERRLKTEAAAHRRLSAKGRAESKEHVRRERLERQQTAAAERRHLSKQETVKFGELKFYEELSCVPTIHTLPLTKKNYNLFHSISCPVLLFSAEFLLSTKCMANMYSTHVHRNAHHLHTRLRAGTVS